LTSFILIAVNEQRLCYFVVVAEEGNMTRAAVQLAVTQPALSQQIQLLEQELGATLFERSRRGVVLTSAGEALACF
jgi:DNA-binding transcriptional LysR family regulator